MSSTESPAHISAAGLMWITGKVGVVPEGAVEGGYRQDKQPTYVVRVLAPDGKYHPGKIAKSNPTGAHYAYDGKEVSSTTFDNLVVSDNKQVIVEWVQASGGKVPAYAIQGERNQLYVGRHFVDSYNALVPGEVDTDKEKCLVVTGNQVFEYSEYEVLCAYPHASTST